MKPPIELDIIAEAVLRLKHRKLPAAVAMGRRRAAHFTSEFHRQGARARWGDRDRCPCGCGLTAERGRKRHPKRVEKLLEMFSALA